MTFDPQTDARVVGHRKDPIYELELNRALLESAQNRPTPNPTLLRGLAREVAYWAQRSIRAVQFD